MHALALAAWLFFAAGEAAPIVVDEVDLVAIAHGETGGAIAIFYGRVQNTPTQLAHRWLSDDLPPTRTTDGWDWLFYDSSDDCWRLVRTTAWVETWGAENPAGRNDGPWFVGLTECGLSPPVRK